MSKIALKFMKVVGMLVVLIILNPHRALIILPAKVIAVSGSWLAWKLEDGCQWLSDAAESARQRFWIFGTSLSEKLEKEQRELNSLVEKKDKEIKGL